MGQHRQQQQQFQQLALLLSQQKPKKKKWFTKSITQRPKRTTTPMPTEENPLLRFYPVEDDFEESYEIPPQMMSDQGGFNAKHSERSSPFTESASSGNHVKFSQKMVI